MFLGLQLKKELTIADVVTDAMISSMHVQLGLSARFLALAPNEAAMGVDVFGGCCPSTALLDRLHLEMSFGNLVCTAQLSQK